MLAWIPNVVAFVAMLGVAGKTLVFDVPTASPTPPTTAAITTFISTLATTDIAWSTLASDYGVFHDAKASGCVAGRWALRRTSADLPPIPLITLELNPCSFLSFLYSSIVAIHLRLGPFSGYIGPQ